MAYNWLWASLLSLKTNDHARSRQVKLRNFGRRVPNVAARRCAPRWDFVLPVDAVLRGDAASPCFVVPPGARMGLLRRCRGVGLVSFGFGFGGGWLGFRRLGGLGAGGRARRFVGGEDEALAGLGGHGSEHESRNEDQFAHVKSLLD